MTTFPGSPRLLKGGIVLIDPVTEQLDRIITLQYNPATLTRKLEMQGAGGGEGGADRSEALRLTGPPVETISLEAEIDAADQLERGDPTAQRLGIQPQLAALESILSPSFEQVLQNQLLASAGTLEIIPMESPLTVFVWSRRRILPIRLTDFSITEEAFDPALNPIRAKVTLGMRVLTFDDLGFGHLGGRLSFGSLLIKQLLAAFAGRGTYRKLGIRPIG